MQAIQSSHTEMRAVAAGQVRASIPNGFGEVDLEPKPVPEITLEFCLRPPRFEGRNLLPKNML